MQCQERSCWNADQIREGASSAGKLFFGRANTLQDYSPISYKYSLLVILAQHSLSCCWTSGLDFLIKMTLLNMDESGASWVTDLMSERTSWKWPWNPWPSGVSTNFWCREAYNLKDIGQSLPFNRNYCFLLGFPGIFLSSLSFPNFLLSENQKHSNFCSGF